MTSYADIWGIDIDKLERERLYHYPKRPDYSEIEAMANAEHWETITRAANLIRYHVDSLRRWRDMEKIRSKKVGGRVYVFMPDILRHAKTLN